jgi:hypothetical protein
MKAGPPGRLGLLAQRSELAADLGREVADAGEVALHRLELAERTLLALAVLEDPGRLLDEAAALLGVARRTWSSWPWPTITCISRPMPESAEELLDVEEAQAVPLIEYSLPPERNIVRLIVTSE